MKGFWCLIDIIIKFLIGWEFKLIEIKLVLGDWINGGELVDFKLYVF